MVVPVPCRFPELLKLLTRNWPATSLPFVTGTHATPYGFSSPFMGTVVPSEVTELKPPINDWAAPTAVPATAPTVTNNATRTRALRIADKPRSEERRVG